MVEQRAPSWRAAASAALLVAAIIAPKPLLAADTNLVQIQRRFRLVGDLRLEGEGYGASTAGSDYSSTLLQEGGVARLYGYLGAPGLLSGWVEGGMFRVNRLGQLEGPGWRYQWGAQLILLGRSRMPLTLFARTHEATGVLSAIPGGRISTDRLGARWDVRLPGLPRLFLQLDQTRFALVSPDVSSALLGPDDSRAYESVTRTGSAAIVHGQKGLHFNGRYELQQRDDLDEGSLRTSQLRQTVHLTGNADLGANTHFLVEGRGDDYRQEYLGREASFGRFYVRSYLRWRPEETDQGYASYDFTGDGFYDYQSHVLQARHDHDISETTALIGGLRAQSFARNDSIAQSTYASMVAVGGARWRRALPRWELRLEDLVDAGAATSDPGGTGLIVSNWLRGDATHVLTARQRLSIQVDSRLRKDDSVLGGSGADVSVGARWTALVLGFHLGASGSLQYGRDLRRIGIQFQQTRQAVAAEATMSRTFGRHASVAAFLGHRLTQYDRGIGAFEQTYATSTVTLQPLPRLSLRGRAGYTQTRFGGVTSGGLALAAESQWGWRQLLVAGVFQYTMDDAAGLDRSYWTFLVRVSRRFTLGG